MESRKVGAAIIAGAVLELLVFLYGLTRRSYLAIAAPVAMAMTGLSALAVWVGWTMLTVEADLPEPELEDMERS